jgi:hypothetical protein
MTAGSPGRVGRHELAVPNEVEILDDLGEHVARAQHAQLAGGREHLPVELAGTGIEILVDHLEAGGIDQHLGGGGEARLDEEHDGGAGKRADQGKAGDDEPALPDPVVEVLDIQREEGAAPLDGRRLAAGHGEGNR